MRAKRVSNLKVMKCYFWDMKDLRRRVTRRLPTEATLLLAEHHYPTVALLRSLGLSCGLSTRVVTDGPQALEALRHLTPALVILSANLETVNGFEVCARMKLMKRLRDVPVVLIADDLDDRVTDASAMVRADGLLTKPIEPSEAETMIQRLTRPKVYGTHLTIPLKDIPTLQ